jgi:hypothetical protein
VLIQCLGDMRPLLGLAQLLFVLVVLMQPQVLSFIDFAV